jgi:hypothetical protein
MVGECATPVAFEKAGTYMVGQKPKCAFHEGTFYFRHNTKSEPATTEDIARAIEREVDRRRAEWLTNIRQVMEAPAGSEVAINPKAIAIGNSTDARAVRLSNDPDAARVAYRSRDITHPYRFKALLAEVNKRLPAGIEIRSGDLQAVRRAYQIDSQPNWVDIAKYASKQYSEAFVGWLVEQFSRDPRFGAKARAKAKREGR